ncbi:fatty alcohol:caffeoyl-CoA acyltransferase [Diospyros lotus]|uniref:fatty alcohol:caffeoyl-CoA acyltransferase n=1 Tax=Diospyros lotus TaxID=55363 RepID=UPI0022500A4A|nr:fatty alcohol:caffeoyl-CoA acyltransferase [Diospyros lotus]
MYLSIWIIYMIIIYRSEQRLSHQLYSNQTTAGKMEVKIIETALVHPSTPPFHHDHLLSLSHLDNDRNLNVTFRYLRAYDSSNRRDAAADPFHVVTTALSAALVHYYPFAGTLRRRDSDGRLELHCEVGRGVPVVRAEVDCSLQSVNYLDDPAELWIEKLVPDPDASEGLADPFVLQITMFRCGGFSLGAAVHHSLGDGLGVTQFFNAMAAFARGSTQLSVEPVWDRANLLRPRDPPRVEFPIHEYLTLESGTAGYRSSEPVCRECFRVKEEWLDRLKLFLHECSGHNFTTFEALGTFIWRAKVKASGIAGDEKVKFVYAMNMRKVVKPPLPAGYWGNGCAPMYVQLSAKDLVERPLWETALLIKKSKHNATDEYVRSFIDFQELNYEKGITAGGGVTGFTDWRHLGHSTVDFGWGGPVTVLPLSRNILGSTEPCFFLPFSSAKGGNKDGFQVLVHAKEAAMAGLKAEMEELSQTGYPYPPS